MQGGDAAMVFVATTTNGADEVDGVAVVATSTLQEIVWNTCFGGIFCNYKKSRWCYRVGARATARNRADGVAVVISAATARNKVDSDAVVASA
ncbi:unnamed protein product [Cylicostephanus goldi]|uniref:Uncharacterized protein n=1 Tax=Cylicostephanus goldi TaxID=71465 RepID=A0A3P6SJB5_CYLGO|nr:unnamed protein product [Cylicostephanus goldi]